MREVIVFKEIKNRLDTGIFVVIACHRTEVIIVILILRQELCYLVQYRFDSFLKLLLLMIIPTSKRHQSGFTKYT